MELKVVLAAAVCLGALLTSASCWGIQNHFNLSLYAAEISHLISDINRDNYKSESGDSAGSCDKVWRGLQRNVREGEGV